MCRNTAEYKGRKTADFTKMRTIMEAMDSDDGTYFERTPKRFDEVYVLSKNVNKKVASLYGKQFVQIFALQVS